MSPRATILLCATLALAAAGCGKTRACKSGTLFVHVDGAAAAGADTLALAISIGGGAAKDVSVAWKGSSGTVEIDFPSGYPSGQTVSVVATATQAGVALATGSGNVTLGAKCEALTLTLSAGAGDGGSGDAGICGGVTACVAGDGCCPATCSNATDSDCPVAVCGDGVVTPPERCDDGNTDNGDACDPTCSFSNTVSLVSGFRGTQGSAESTDPTRVRFYSPQGITTDGTVLYVGDANGVIRQTDPTSGATTYLAGAAGMRTTVDDPSGANARFTGPMGLAWLNNTGTSNKELFILDGNPSPAGNIPTSWQVRRMLVSDPNHPTTTFLAASTFTGGLGNVYAIAAGIPAAGPRVWALTDAEIATYRSLTGGSGSDAPIANQTQLNTAVYPPMGTATEGNCFAMAYAGSNIMYVGCPRVILKVDFSGASAVVTVFAGTPKSTATCADNAVATSATLVHPTALALDSTGALYFSDCNKIHKVSGGGVTSVAGDGTDGVIDAPANPAAAEFGIPYQTAAIGTTLFTVDLRVRKITTTGVTSLAGLDGTHGGPIYDATGATSSYTISGNLSADAHDIYSTVFYQRQLFSVALSNGGSSILATLPTITTPPGSNFPGAITRLGNKFYIAYEDGEVRQIDSDGTNEQAFAGTPGVTSKVTALANDGTNLYYVNAVKQIGRLDSTGLFTVLAGASGSTMVQDGTGTGAKFSAPTGLVLAGGALYTLDGPVGTSNLSTVVRKIAPIDGAAGTGVVTTIVGQSGTVGAVDDVGTAARLAGASDLATDGKSLFVLDRGGGPVAGDGNGPTLRQVELASARVTTMLGTRGVWSASPGVGKNAWLNIPSAIVFEPTSGDLFFFDENAFFRIH